MSNPFSSPSAPASPSPTSSARVPSVLGRVLLALLGINVLLELASRVSDGLGALLFADTWTSEVPADDPLELVLVFSTFLSGVGLMLVYIVTVVVWCIWSYRVAVALRDLGTEGLAHSPGWVVGWWFVPFANLVKPFQVTSELYRAAGPEHDGFDWAMRSAPAFLAAWWAFWLAGNIGGRIEFRLVMNGLGNELLPVLNVVVGFFSIGATVLAFVVVRGIETRLEARAARRA